MAPAAVKRQILAWTLTPRMDVSFHEKWGSSRSVLHTKNGAYAFIQ